MMLTQPKIILKHIHKTFNGKQVLAIDETVIPLEGVVGIVGWSGAGKSTLLNILSLIDYPDRSPRGGLPQLIYFLPRVTYRVTYKVHKRRPEIEAIDVGGEVRIIDENRFRRRLFGFIFQEHYLHPNLNILYNIKTPLFSRLKTIAEQKLVNACSALAISDHLTSFSSRVSGGQAQRASILRGLLKNAPLLFGDEITNNLDYARSEMVLRYVHQALRDKRNHLSVFFWVSHNIHLIKEYADHIIIIKDGQLDCRPNDFNSFEAIMAHLAHDGGEKKNVPALPANPFRFDAKNANWSELVKYYFSYAYNDLFKNKYFPTVDFLMVVLSLSFVILFLFTVIKISYTSHRYVELKLSDPRINFLEVRADAYLGELTLDHLTQLKEKLGDSIRFIAPVYYVTTLLKDLKQNRFRSNSNAITFRKGDPIVQTLLKHGRAPFITADRGCAGLIMTSARARQFGYDAASPRVIASFNNFNADFGDQPIPLQLIDAQLPFNKTMMMREEFYIENYKKSFYEEKPPVAFFIVYPMSIHDTVRIKKRIEKAGHFEIVDAFKVKNKVAIIEEIKKQTQLFVWLSIIAVTLLAVFFVSVTLYRSLYKKHKEIGVFLAYGMRKRSFQIFYLCESLIIIATTFVITWGVYRYGVETLINHLITRGSLLDIIGLNPTDTPIRFDYLRVPSSWLMAIYLATYSFLTIFLMMLIQRLTLCKPITLIRDDF